MAAAVHDLLQPLNAARMFTSLLRSHLPDEAGRHAADSIEGALAAQDAILNSLLDISRMESGQLEVHIRDVPLGPLLQVLGHNFGVLAESQGLQLRCVPTRAVVRTDENLLRRILQNFVSNAIRYSRRGRIVVGCRRMGGHLRIEVHDQGPGIPEALQREIFEEFRRLDEGRADDRAQAWAWPSSKRLGRLLGHEIGLRSPTGRGSVSGLRAAGRPGRSATPSAPPPRSPHQTTPRCRQQRLGDRRRRPHLRRHAGLAATLGLRRALAGGAPQALEQAAQGGAAAGIAGCAPGRGLPGPEVYAELCQRWGQSPAVILVTAERATPLRRQAAERGWGFLAKPVRAPALRALVSQTLLRLK